MDNDPGRTSQNLRRAVDGDRAALEQVVERLTPLLLAQARHRIGPVLAAEVDPEDVVADVWLRTLPKLAEIGAEADRRTPVLLRYLSTSVLQRINNLVTRTLRRGPRAADLDDATPGGLDDLEASVTHVVSRIARGELSEQVLERLDRLPEDDRAVVVLRGIEQRPFRDVAELLGVTENTATVRYRRALEKLRAELPGSLFDEL